MKRRGFIARLTALLGIATIGKAAPSVSAEPPLLTSGYVAGETPPAGWSGCTVYYDDLDLNQYYGRPPRIRIYKSNLEVSTGSEYQPLCYSSGQPIKVKVVENQ